MEPKQQNKKILVTEIIEDEASMIEILSDRFKEKGVNVIEAKNGDEGLRLALKEHPDVIVLDLVMPKMDGFEMLKKLRDDEWGKTAEVIVFTNLGEDSAEAKTFKSGVSEYLIKADWTLNDLIKKVQEKLKLKE